MFTKKFLLAAAVATAVTGNANAVESNGLTFSGGVRAGYNYKHDDESGFTTNSYNVDKVRLTVSKDLSQFQKGLSVSARVDGDEGSENTAILKHFYLSYALNDSLTISAGSGYYGGTDFNDMTSTFGSAFFGIAGNLGTGDYRTYGGELSYSAGSLSFTLNGGVRGEKDLLDTSTTSENNTATSFFDNGRYEKSGIVAARLDYNNSGFNVGVGALYQDMYGNNDPEEGTNFGDQEKRGAKVAGALDLSYAQNGLLTFAAAGVNTFSPKNAEGNVEQIKTETKADVVVGALFGVNGEFDNFGTVVKANNFVYFGAQAEGIAEKIQFDNDTKDKDTTTTKLTGVLGYAPNPNVVVSATYSVGKTEIDNGTETVTDDKYKAANLTVRLSF